MSIALCTPSPFAGFAAKAHGQQAGASAVHASRATLTRQYQELRLQLVDLHRAIDPDMLAIDQAIDRLSQLQSDIKSAHGGVGSNPI